MLGLFGLILGVLAYVYGRRSGYYKGITDYKNYVSMETFVKSFKK